MPYLKAAPWKDIIVHDNPEPDSLEPWEKVISGIFWVAVRDSVAIPTKPRRNPRAKLATFTEMKRVYQYKLRDKRDARTWLLTEANGLWHNIAVSMDYESFIAGLQEKWREIGNSRSRAQRFLSDLGRLEKV